MNRLAVLLAVAALSACIRVPPPDLNDRLSKQIDEVAPGLILPKAAFELSCPKQDLTVVPVGSRQYGVKGCGRKATWGVVCQANVVEAKIYRESCGATKLTETSAALD
jgi:hypothetical protein